jgi:hypothetical protein
VPHFKENRVFKLPVALQEPRYNVLKDWGKQLVRNNWKGI